MTAPTIAAIATPPGRGGVGIVRVSGPASTAIARVVTGVVPPPRKAQYVTFRNVSGEAVDLGLALYFPAPHSFTGEDVLELHGHGGPVVMDRLLNCVLACGARIAEPGEFSRRAFLNGKLDLAEAEAIADLIDSASEHAARLALRSLQGEFSRVVKQSVEELVRIRTFVESAIDFPGEDIEFLARGQIERQVRDVAARVNDALAAARQGCVLREGITVVIAGQPNAGKSTLLNQLAGRDVAIVTEIPGTTRDVLRAEIQLDGLPLHIIDTAGLRDSADPVEQEGIRRAWQQIEQADVCLLLIDDRAGITDHDRVLLERIGGPARATLVFNKIDLTGRTPGLHEAGVAVSARTGIGIDALRAYLKQRAGISADGEGAFLARRRHVDALQRAGAALQRAAEMFFATPAIELLAEELRAAQHHLGEITGEFTSDDLLGEIFASFCIGK